MARLTINISDEYHQALKEAAAKRGKTIGNLVEESLAFYGIKTRQSALEILEKATAHSKLSEQEAMALALKETNAEREK